MSRASRPSSFVVLAVVVTVALCGVGLGSVPSLTPGSIGLFGTQADSPGVEAGQTAEGERNRSTATPDATAEATTPTGESTPQTATPAPTQPTAAPSGHTYQYTVRDGANASTVHVVDSGRPGPTIAVVGGQHGNEPAGSAAAAATTSWHLDRGVLVVVPRANPRALRNGTRKVDGRDLNAQFPVGERPTSAQARSLWRVLVRHEVDVVVDLHSSEGIYGVDGGVGQAVFPTVTGDAVAHADRAVARTNREFGLEGNRSFRRGNAMGRSGKSLTRKVAGDLNETAYVVETTKRGTDEQTRVEWTTAVTWEVLRLHGVVSGTRHNRTERGTRGNVALSDA